MEINSAAENLTLLTAVLRAMRQPDLPILEIEQPLLETLTTQKRLVLTAPTPLGEIDPSAADAARRRLLRAGAHFLTRGGYF